MRHDETFLRRYARNRTGSTAAEFALVLPLFVAIVFSIMEYGIVFFVYVAMQASTVSVARGLAVNDISVANAAAATKAKLPSWVAGSSTVTVTQSNAANPSVNVISINVDAPVAKATPLALFTLVTPWTMHVVSSVSQERPYVD